MVKLVALYGHPQDPQQFEQFYANTHGPMAARLPGLRGAFAAKIAPNPDGTPAPYYRIAELTFDSPEDLRAAMSSEVGRAMTADMPKFATGGVTTFVALPDQR